MKITKEVLINDGWKEVDFFNDGKIISYNKTINGFHYTASYQPNLGNWFDWQVHIDNPDFESVGCLEISTLEDIDKLAEIYIHRKKI